MGFSAGETTAFESAWMDVAPRIKSMVQREGATPDVADDVVQETGMKLFTTWDRVDPTRPLWPLVRTIALNALRDRVRRDRLRPIGDVPDEAMGYDLEDHVLARARLRCVGTAMSELGAPDRVALLTEVSATKSATSSRVKMARLRARRKLDRALQEVAGAFGVVELAARRICALELPRAVANIQPVAPIAIGLVAILGATSPTMPQVASRTPFLGARPSHVQLVAQREPTSHRSATRSAAHDRRRRSDDLSDGRPASLGTTKVETQPSASPSSRPRTVASAGDTRATTKEGQGYRSVGVCSGGGGSGDDQYASVTIDDGSQNANEDEGPCS